MNEQEALKFDKDTEVYSFGFHQNVIQYITLLAQKGYTLDDVKRFIPARQKMFDKVAETLKFTEQKCPECNGLMTLLSVNDQPGTQTGDDSQSAWMCQKQKCGETIYNKESVQEIINKAKRSK